MDSTCFSKWGFCQGILLLSCWWRPGSKQEQGVQHEIWCEQTSSVLSSALSPIFLCVKQPLYFYPEPSSPWMKCERLHDTTLGLLSLCQYSHCIYWICTICTDVSESFGRKPSKFSPVAEMPTFSTFEKRVSSPSKSAYTFSSECETVLNTTSPYLYLYFS